MSFHYINADIGGSIVWHEHDRFCIVGNYIYYDSAIILYASNYNEAKHLCETIWEQRDSYYFVGYMHYEFFHILQDNGIVREEPLACFEGFSKRRRLGDNEINPDTDLRYYPYFTKTLDFTRYKSDFNYTKECIKRGQSYQVNLTQELHMHTNIDSFELFKILSKRQDTKYKMYYKNKYIEILSFSPELFFQVKTKHDHMCITARPMKGTMRTGNTKTETKRNKKLLKQDSKNRSENIMIVDLLRNDLGSIAIKDSIKVTKLFSIESYKTILQMTSTIKAKLALDITLVDILHALFPCGSITGCPKLETMGIIKYLENRDRGLYCGAIGVIGRKKSIFSIPIRTLYRRHNAKHFIYGIGSGIVWDSTLMQEYKELELKARFLENKEDFYLFETMYMRDNKVLFFKEHIERMLNSAKHFSFSYENLQDRFYNLLQTRRDYNIGSYKDLSDINMRLFSGEYGFFDSFENSVASKSILRLVLEKSGNYGFTILPLNAHKSDILKLSRYVLSKDDHSYHKTSLRTWQDKESELWQSNACFDIAYCNNKGELCEGSRSNIIVNIDNKYYTPDVDSGLLNGIYRQFLLRIGAIQERIIYKDELEQAKEVYAINSLRGLCRVYLEHNK